MVAAGKISPWFPESSGEAVLLLPCTHRSSAVLFRGGVLPWVLVRVACARGDADSKLTRERGLGLPNDSYTNGLASTSIQRCFPLPSATSSITNGSSYTSSHDDERHECSIVYIAQRKEGRRRRRRRSAVVLFPRGHWGSSKVVK